MLDLFGLFLLILILIGVERIELVSAYATDGEPHIDVVLEVALVAVAQKVVTLEITKTSGGVVAAVAAIILALELAIARVRRRRGRSSARSQCSHRPPGASRNVKRVMLSSGGSGQLRDR